MIKNHLLIAWRNLVRNKTYSFINIAGLSIGLACAILIVLYVKDEVSYDKWHKNADQIFRIVNESKFNGVERKDSNTGILQGPRFSANVPGIQSYVRVQGGTEDIKNGVDILPQKLLYVDSSFFSVFTFSLLSGNPSTCLAEPHSVVLSEDAAIKYLGTKQAVGKLIMIKENNQFVPFRVTAVSERCPQNSSIQFDMLLPFRVSETDASNKENWFNFFLNTFVVLGPNAGKQAVEEQMQSIYKRDAAETFKEIARKFDLGADANMGKYFLQPFTDIHMNTELPAQNGLENASNPVYAYILSGIALFVLLIACINFVNLTVARSVKRAREIGIRKVIGSSRKQLIIQFMGESFVLCALAFSLAFLIVEMSLPVFNHLANKSLSLSYLADGNLIGMFALLFLFTALLAGFYPALVLSGYKPVETLYGRLSLPGKNYLQKSLVVLQFALASFLIISTLTIYSQFNFLTKTELGYTDKNIVEIQANTPQREAAVFKAELLKNPNITDVAPKNGGNWTTTAKISNDSSINFSYETIDESFLPMFKIPVVSGRNFSKAFPSDSTRSVLVNESFVRKAGWKNPIGETVNFFYNDNEIYQVVGVVKDYHYQALNQKIGPQLFTMKNSNWYGIFNVKIKPGSETESLKHIQKTFRQVYPLSPYSYIFKDEQRIKQYESEAKWKQIILFGAILTIFISCIGLFGLSVLSAEKRTKEIGIRKVLGASVKSIVATLSKDFLKLVSIALIIAIPLAWLAAGKWLENYPYRIALDWWIFATACLLVLLVALATVSFQAIKAAIANPVKSLRTE